MSPRHYGRKKLSMLAGRRRLEWNRPMNSALLYFLLKCKAMAEVKMSAKNQIVVPQEAREALGVKPGDKLLAVVFEDQLIISRKPASYTDAIRAIGVGLYPPDYLDKERDSWD
jgi:AbrB family looped-hinge helix DNA binding protein